MKEGQDKLPRCMQGGWAPSSLVPQTFVRVMKLYAKLRIYFVTGEGRRAAEIAPAMEKMRQKDYEASAMLLGSLGASGNLFLSAPVGLGEWGVML